MRHAPVDQRIRIRILQAGGLALAASLLLVHPALVGNVHEIIEMVGFALVLACVGGRMWSILYIGSKKNQELMTSGPYSMTRNPLYFFSTLGAVGVGLMVGSLTLALVLGFAVYRVLLATAEREAEHLATLFGARYETYARETPMFWPKLSLHRDSPEVVFSPRALRRTFLDGVLFLMAFPLIELIEHLQVEGYLPILVRLF